MSNSFNISVEPEIAAAVVKIDAIKADTGPIRNDVTSIHDIGLPAVIADCAALRNDVTAIHDIGLPAVIADCAALRNDVTDIHDTEIPFIKTNTISILNRANSIKAKTDALPQNVRGKSYSAQLSTAESAFQVVCDVTGHGIINQIGFQCDAADSADIKITLDGTVLSTYTYPGNGGAAVYNLLIPSSPSSSTRILSGVALTSERNFNNEYDTSFKVEIRRATGTTADVHCKVYYTLDGF